ncbi:hypothetical protein MMC17_003626 [Xylographa soralifera]|nr:hypothetical protein [Xylographa soralifera]
MGGGIHEWDITKETLESILYYDNITLISYGPAIACTKSAILLLYLRVFSPRRWSTLDVTVRALILIICGFYIALSVAKICQCIPRARIWDNTVPGQCVNLPVLLDTSGLFNIISDVLILLVPLKGVWSLQMARKRKMGIYLIFTVGIIAPVFSIIGLVKRFQLAGSPDQSYNQPLILLWAEAELATGMMIICLPTLPGVLHRHSKRPSKSVVNGSARSRSLKFFPHHGQSSTNRDDMLEDRDYFELTEGRIADSSVMMPKRAFINEITGGHGNTHADYDLGESEAIGTPVGGILKMTTIEQFDA